KDKDKAAFVDAESKRAISFAQVKTGAERIGAALAERGMVKGDVCAIYAPNLPEYPLAFIGIMVAGGIVTTVNPLTSPHDLCAQLKD
ncbi:AMP-binding protein, partial [Acinetobacter baumannii]